MTQVVVYKTEEGGIAIVHPTQEALSKYSLKQIADKDVPHGKAYAIKDLSEIPVDRTFRAAWEIDDEDLVEGVGAESNEFPKEV